MATGITTATPDGSSWPGRTRAIVGPRQSAGRGWVPKLLTQTRQSAAASAASVDQRTGSWSGAPPAKLVRRGPPVCQPQT